MKHFKLFSMLLLLLPIEVMAQFAWDGSKGKVRVNTGMGNATNTSGTWFVFTDKNDGGGSYVTWSYPYENNLPTDEHVKRYGGIKGLAVLNKKDIVLISPYVDVGFCIVGESSDPKERYEAGDVSSWGGLAVTYQSDNIMNLQLGFTDKEELRLEYALPEYYLPASDTEKYVEIPWSKFIQPDWGRVRIAISDAVKELATIKFHIQGKEGTYSFKVSSIGSIVKPGVVTGITTPNIASDNNDDWYTVSGVRLKNQPTTRGVYIHHGQKLVVK